MAKLVFHVDSLLPALSQVVGVVNSKNALPILGDIVFTTKNGDLSLTSSDSETWLDISAPCVECDGDLHFCINATDIYKALQNLKGKTVTMALDEEAHTVKCTYDNGHFALPFEDATEFPKANMDMAGAVSRTLGGGHFVTAIKQAEFATASDELRPIMNGVHFDFLEEGMISVATDGHKLAKAINKAITLELTDGIVCDGFTLPKKPAHILINVLNGFGGDITMTNNDKCVIVRNGDFTLATRLIEGHYPNYNSVIPQDNNVITTVDKAAFVSALKRVIPMSNSSSELIQLAFTAGKVTLSAVDYDFSKSASEDVVCDYNGEDLTIGFKGSTLMEITQSIGGDSIRIALKDCSRAGLFAPANEDGNVEYLALLMPMLIQN